MARRVPPTGRDERLEASVVDQAHDTRHTRPGRTGPVRWRWSACRCITDVNELFGHRSGQRNRIGKGRRCAEALDAGTRRQTRRATTGASNRDRTLAIRAGARRARRRADTCRRAPFPTCRSSRCCYCWASPNTKRGTLDGESVFEPARHVGPHRRRYRERVAAFRGAPSRLANPTLVQVILSTLDEPGLAATTPRVKVRVRYFGVVVRKSSPSLARAEKGSRGAADQWTRPD